MDTNIVEMEDISIKSVMVWVLKLIEAEWRIYALVNYATIYPANGLGSQGTLHEWDFAALEYDDWIDIGRERLISIPKIGTGSL